MPDPRRNTPVDLPAPDVVKDYAGIAHKCANLAAEANEDRRRMLVEQQRTQRELQNIRQAIEQGDKAILAEVDLLRGQVLSSIGMLSRQTGGRVDPPQHKHLDDDFEPTLNGTRVVMTRERAAELLEQHDNAEAARTLASAKTFMFKVAVVVVAGLMLSASTWAIVSCAKQARAAAPPLT